MLPPRQPARRTRRSEKAILEASRRHSLRLGKLAIDASNRSWKHDEAERTARLASGAARIEAFDRLDALNGSYPDDEVAVPAPAISRVTRFHAGPTALAGRAAGGAAAILAVLGLAVFTHSFIPADPRGPDVGTTRETWTLATPATVAEMRQAIENAAAAFGAMPDEGSAYPDRVALIHPVWRH